MKGWCEGVCGYASCCISFSSFFSSSLLLYPRSSSPLSPPPPVLPPPPQCDANPDITKVAIQEDKYENILTLITYYQMVKVNHPSTSDGAYQLAAGCVTEAFSTISAVYIYVEIL